MNQKPTADFIRVVSVVGKENMKNRAKIKKKEEEDEEEKKKKISYSVLSSVAGHIKLTV